MKYDIEVNPLNLNTDNFTFSNRCKTSKVVKKIT